MSAGIGTIEVKIRHGKVVVQGLGKTTRGQRYIKVAIPLKVASIADKNFKSEMASVVEAMLG